MAKLEEIGWSYGIKDIEKKILEYSRSESSRGIPVKFYPTINGFESVDSYESYVNVLIISLAKDLSRSKKALAKMTIAFKFSENEKLREMNFIDFVYNIIMWRPYIVSNIPVTEKDIFNPEVFNNSKYNDYLNRFAEKYRDRFTMAEYSKILYGIQVFMNKLAVSIGPLFGNSLSIHDMLQMARRNADINEMINTKIDLDNFQVSEVEEFLVRLTDRFFKTIMGERNKHNPLKAFIRAKAAMNPHQVQETYLHLGFKPDLDGNTIPITTNSNLLTEGLKTPEAIYVDSKGGRKAAILQKGVADAGYFSRHASFVTSDITLNDDPSYSCDTVNLVKVKITNQRNLESFSGRFMKVGDRKYKVITRNDNHLIGTEIEVRSPVTCAAPNNKICKTCYGTLYNVNYGMHAGRYAAIDANESKTQIGLSAKHALATNSVDIDIHDENLFLSNQNGWLFNLNTNINRDNYELLFNQTDIQMENQEDYDKYDNYFTHRLVFRNVNNGEIFEVYEKKDMRLCLSKQLFNLLKQKKFFSIEKGENVVIPLKKVSTDKPFVFLRITNNELTKPIKQLAKFIQKGEKPFKDIKDYNEYVVKINDLFRQGGMNIPSVHIEMIIRNLIRRKKDELLLPDWSVTQTPDMYKFVSMNKASILSSSVITGLMFEKVKQQLASPHTYKKRESSLYSLLFINE